MGVGLLVGAWVARYLGPEQFGLLNFATAFIGLFGTIAGLGLQGIVVRDIVRDPDTARLTLGTAAVMQLVGGLVAYLLILGTIVYLRSDDALARTIVTILGAILLFKASEIAVFWFESQVQSKYTVWVQNGIFLIFAVVKVGLILSHAPLIAFVWAMLGEAIVIAIILTVIFGLRGPKLASLSASTERTKTLLKDSWPLILSGLSIMLYMKIDQIMLAQMIGDKAVGTYSAATRISEVWYFIPMTVVASVFPAILEAKKQSEMRYHSLLQKLFDLMVVMGLLVAIPMTFLSSHIIALMFGAAYSDASAVLSIHIWASVFVFLGVAGSRWFIAEDKLFHSLLRTFAGAALNITLNIFLIPISGAIGAAIALLISQIFSSWIFDFLNKSTRYLFVMKSKAMNPVNIIGTIKLMISR